MSLYLKLLAVLALLVIGSYSAMHASEGVKATMAEKHIEVAPAGPDLRLLKSEQYYGINRISLSTSGYIEQSGTLLY